MLIFLSSCIGASLLALSGCTSLGYRLGSSLPPDIRTIYVPAFRNLTSEPQMEGTFTEALISELQRDGTLRLASENSADVILTGTLVRIADEALRFRRDEADSAEEYRLHILATITLTRTGSGATLMVDRKIEGRADFDFIGDMTSSRRTALPEASLDLARNIVSALIEHW